jgi:hypothetical protein
MSATREQLARVKANIAQKKKLAKKLEAKARREETAEARKLDTRRKALLGAWVLESAREDHEAAAKRKEKIAVMILSRATEYRVYEVMKDLYKEFTGKDLPEPSKPEKVRPETIQPSPDSLFEEEGFAGGIAALSEQPPNAAEEPLDHP